MRALDSSFVYIRAVDRVAVTSVPSFFPSVALKVTNACRLKCSFCCEPARKEIGSRRQLFLVLERLLRNGTQRFCLTGGEPILLKDTPDILRVLKESGAHSVLSVADSALFLRKYDQVASYLNFVRFSLHAVGEAHDKIVGLPGTYRATLESMKRLRGTTPFSISIVAIKENVACLPDLVRVASDAGAARINVYSVLNSGLGFEFAKRGMGANWPAVDAILDGLASAFPATKINRYSYDTPGECVLVYRNGDVLLDPWPVPPYQFMVGNLLIDEPRQVWLAALKGGTVQNYIDHIDK